MKKMNSAIIYVKNISCSACADIIGTVLLNIAGVNLVNVNIETGEVKVIYEGNNLRAFYVQALLDKGYPEFKNSVSITN